MTLDGQRDEATADRVASGLRSAMLTGSLRPGEPLRDAAIALQYGVSRNTVREAFRLLQGDGLTEHRRHRGTVVKRLSASDVRDAYVVRRAIELRAIEMINNAPDDLVRIVEERVVEAEQALEQGRWQDVGTASLAFHVALVGTLGSPTLDTVMNAASSRLRLAFASLADEGAFQAPWVRRDREINDLIQRGRSAEARNALRLYLDDSEHQVLGAVREYLCPEQPGAARSGPGHSGPIQPTTKGRSWR